MDGGIRHGWSTWADLKRGDEFGGGVKGDPHPEVVGLVAQGGEELVQLKMAEVEVVEEVGVHLFGVLARA